MPSFFPVLFEGNRADSGFFADTILGPGRHDP
jgi:hypothetical protein